MAPSLVVAPSIDLPSSERAELARCEGIIERGLRTFTEVGNALLRIRDGRLYRAEFATFEAYCRERWGMRHNYADRLIRAAVTVTNLVPTGTIPSSERQARPLTRLAPEQQAPAWQRAVETAPDGKVTAAHVRKVVDEEMAARPAQLGVSIGRLPRLIVGKAECMHEIADGTVDIIITSPPYNLGAQVWHMGGSGRQPRSAGIGYEDDLAEAAYQGWQIQCLREMYRVSKVGGSLFYNHKVRQSNGGMIHPLDWLRSAKNPWKLRQEIVWDRGSTHNHSATLFWPHDERVYWMTKGKPSLDRAVSLSTIWRFHGPVPGTWHPAPFPAELPRRCLEAVGMPGQTVLDPFAGSCVVVQVALGNGYEAIGLDVSAQYLRRAARENGWIAESAA